MKSSQSNFKLGSPSSYYVRSYLITTVCLCTLIFQQVVTTESQYIGFSIGGPLTSEILMTQDDLG